MGHLTVPCMGHWTVPCMGHWTVPCMGHWTVPCMVLPGLNADVTYNKNYLPVGRHGVYYIENLYVFAYP